MTEIAVEPVDAQRQPEIKLPPSPRRAPKFVQGLAFVMLRRRVINRLSKRYGGAFAIDAPLFGKMVVVTDPALARQVYAASPDDLGNVQPNLSRMFGPGSIFALDGTAHRSRRKLLTPPFHGRAMHRYEAIVEEETEREIANWRDGEEFPTLEPMMRITLKVILRAIFGADGAELAALREKIPAWVTLGSRLVVLPAPKRTFGPWKRLRQYREEYDAVVETLIEQALADEKLDERTDILSLLMRSRYDDGTAMTHSEIADELLTLLAAGHETTASTLAWAFERIRRHPEVLDRLAAEADTDDAEFRQAVIHEVQRNRTVIDFASRHVYAPVFALGEWRIPRGLSVSVAIAQMHWNEAEFPDPQRFDPERFLGQRAAASGWIPFGGGTRRCVGAAFANMEMHVVLRTVLRRFRIETTDGPGEKAHNRGVAFVPRNGGRITVHRRGR